MRLTLVSNERIQDAQFLAKALYSILMLLPQTEAFHLLRNRLQCTNYWHQQSIKMEDESGDSAEFQELLQHFKTVQALHRTQKLEQRKISIQLWEKNKWTRHFQLLLLYYTST